MNERIWHHLSAMGGKGTFGGVSVAWGSGTDVGRARSVNEDAVIAAPPVFIVADGMGGHDAGDVASALVVERFRRLGGGEPATSQQVSEMIGSVNEEIFDAGSTSDGDRSMGTTAVGLVLVQNGDAAEWMLFNVGDSRAYRIIDGRLELLSVDHSYVQELVSAGQITAEDARSHPQRNVVTRALGVDRAVQADLWVRPPESGERFLLCSDGLSSEVGDDEIARQLGVPGDPDVVASSLVGAALNAGGRDNVTVLVIDVIDVEGSIEQVTAPRVALDGIAENVLRDRVDDPPFEAISSTGAADADENLIEVPPTAKTVPAPDVPTVPDAMIESVPSELTISTDVDSNETRSGSDG